MIDRFAITQPTLFVDVARARANIGRMAQKAAASGVRFRPHFKTHQSDYIGELYRDAGVTAICVSSVDMAEYFADAGWHDITLLVPVNWLQIERINALARRVTLALHVESVETARVLAERLTDSVGVWIEIDTGRKRTGVWWENTAAVLEIARTISQSPRMTLRGILTFAGQTYSAASSDDAARIYDETAMIMNGLRDHLAAAGHTGLEISVGDTPGCSAKDHFHGVDEIRPGTMVFYDVMQTVLGACHEDDIAIAVGCPVIAKYADRLELVIYGGAVHFSRDWMRLPDSTTIFGWVTTFNDTGWNRAADGCYVADLSQEIGVVRVTQAFFDSVTVGDVLAILPVHACLTVNEMRRFTTLDGETHTLMPIPVVSRFDTRILS